MNPNDAAKLLAIAAAFDNRKPDATAAQAWAMALGDYRFEDCQRAIVEHYQASTEWIMPAHVLTSVKKTRASRLEDVALSPPPGMDPDKTGDYARWLEVTRRAVADGREPPTEEYPATRAIGELRAVLKSVPKVVALPAKKTAEHQAAMEAARAELPPAAPMPGLTDAPPLRDPEPDQPDTEPDEPQEAMG